MNFMTGSYLIEVRKNSFCFDFFCLDVFLWNLLFASVYMKSFSKERVAEKRTKTCIRVILGHITSSLAFYYFWWVETVEFALNLMTEKAAEKSKENWLVSPSLIKDHLYERKEVAAA